MKNETDCKILENMETMFPYFSNKFNTEAATPKKEFLEISQNSQENTCAGVFF